MKTLDTSGRLRPTRRTKHGPRSTASSAPRTPAWSEPSPADISRTLMAPRRQNRRSEAGVTVSRPVGGETFVLVEKYALTCGFAVAAGAESSAGPQLDWPSIRRGGFQTGALRAPTPDPRGVADQARSRRRSRSHVQDRRSGPARCLVAARPDARWYLIHGCLGVTSGWKGPADRPAAWARLRVGGRR